MQIILSLWCAVNFQYCIYRHHWRKFPKPSWDQDFLFAIVPGKTLPLGSTSLSLGALYLARTPMSFRNVEVAITQGQYLLFSPVCVCVCVCVCPCVCVCVCVCVFSFVVEAWHWHCLGYCKSSLSDMTIIFGRETNNSILYVMWAWEYNPFFLCGTLKSSLRALLYSN